MGRNNNHRLVYASDGSHHKNEKNMADSRRVIAVKPEDVVVKIRLEKKGRGGKSVSVLFNLPHNPEYFSKLGKKIKAHCGTGGTFKEDQIEIQGDHREKIKSFLEGLGFQVKLAGG